MGLGIERKGYYITASIPLFSGSDTMWQDNSWIIEHLVQLAQHIKEENCKIHSVKMETVVGYGPQLVIEYTK